MAGVTIPITAPSTSAVASIQTVNSALNNMGSTAAAANVKLNAATGSTANLGTAGQKAAAAMGPLGGILGRISPQAGAAASSIAGLASAGQGLAAAGTAAGLSMGTMAAAAAPVLVVVGLLALAYQDYAKGLEDAKKFQDALAEGHKTELSLLDQNKDAVRDRLKEQGKWTAGMAAATQAAEDQKKLEEANKPLLEARATLQKEINDAVTAHTNIVTADGADTKDRAGDRIKELDQQIAANKALLDDTNNERAATAELADAKKKQAAEDAAADAAADKADKARAERLRKEAEELARVKAAVEAVAAAEKTLLDIAHTSSVANLDDLGKEDDAYKTKLTAITAAHTAGKNAGMDAQQLNDDTLAAIQAATQEHEANIAAIKQAARAEEEAEYEQFLDRRAALDKQAADVEAAQAAQTRQYAATSATAAINGIMAVQQARQQSFDTSTAEGKKAAMKQWKTQHVLNEAQVVALAIVSGMQAAASAPFPANLPAMIASSIESTAAIAAIVATPAPKFHMGTTGARRPDEFAATLQKDEGVVTSQGMSKPGMKEAVRAANAGQAPAAVSQQPAVIQFRHKVYNRYMRENLRAGGPLADKFTLGKKIGHREVRT